MTIYKCRNWLLDTTERRILKDGVLLDITPKSFDLIQLLVERPGKIFTKDEILGLVWNGTIVEEANLPVQIFKIRRALGETKESQLIETISGVGYRFVGLVKVVPRREWEKLQNSSESSLENAKVVLPTVAVLPFKNQSDETEFDYIVDGITEELINHISKLSEIRVLARATVFRYNNSDLPLHELIGEYDVESVIVGRMRVQGPRLTVNCELIRCSDGTQRWGKSFRGNFDDVIAIEAQILKEVAQFFESRSKAKNGELSESAPRNAESHRLLLKARFLHEKSTESDINSAISYLLEAVGHDVTNTHAYVELIECYFSLFFFDYLSYQATVDKITPFLKIVSGLDQDLDVVQAMLGGKKMYLDWDFEAAEEHLLRAIGLNRNCLTARYRYTNFLITRERFAEALVELQTIKTQDPLSVSTLIRTGRIFFKLGQFENAESYFFEVLELSPGNYIALDLLAATKAELGELEKAASILGDSLEINFNLETVSMLGYVRALLGDREGANELIGRLRADTTAHTSRAFKIARIHLGLKEYDEAFRLLGEAIRERDVDLISIKSNPCWTRVSDDERYRVIIKTIDPMF
ncbi:MAG: winged helix-turn-helix domain-containing protein [Acidobacteria bacterium]|nr:winged helix-turn-helix domain-containing protein [Acidobacteriota bacterium]